MEYEEVNVKIDSHLAKIEQQTKLLAQLAEKFVGECKAALPDLLRAQVKNTVRANAGIINDLSDEQATIAKKTMEQFCSNVPERIDAIYRNLRWPHSGPPNELQQIEHQFPRWEPYYALRQVLHEFGEELVGLHIETAKSWHSQKERIYKDELFAFDLPKPIKEAAEKYRTAILSLAATTRELSSAKEEKRRIEVSRKWDSL